MGGTGDPGDGAKARPRLTGPERGKLRDLLRAAFPPSRFDEFLEFRLDRHIYDYAGPADDYPTALRRVLQEANASLWWRDLLREARKAVPGDPGLMEFGEEFGLSPVVVADRPSSALRGRHLELKIKAAQSTFDIGTWRRRLGEIEGQVCRIECPAGTARGTGFLVGPSMVLTNYHVIEPLVENGVAGDAARVAIRFDYKVADDGVAVQAGVIYPLARDWLADFSRYSPQDLRVKPFADPEPDELDYALLRLDGAPGEEPVGGATDDPNRVSRRWVEVSTGRYDFAEHPALYIVQHPDGRPMQVALDTEAVIGLNENGTRVRYTTTTEPGSSGSPCFGPDWQWVAVHHSGDPKYWAGGRPTFNEGIPVSAIRRLLTERGKADLLGGSRDSDSRDLRVRIYSRSIAEPIPADTDTHSDLEDAGTASKPTIGPPPKPLPADGIDVQVGPATETQVQASLEGRASELEERLSERITRPEQIASLADEIAAKDPYDAADELAVLPSSQAAHILTLMNPETASLVLVKLQDGAAYEILRFLESDTLIAILGRSGLSDNTVRILELAEGRLAAATLSKMQVLSSFSGGMVLRKMEPRPAAAIIDEMTRGELDRAGYFSTGLPPDPLYRLIDYVSIERSLYLMSKISVGRTAGLLENMVQRNSERGDELLREMNPKLAGEIIGEMNISTAARCVTRMDAAAAKRILETMPPKKAATLRKGIEKPDEG